jgi:hypothetical protein
MGAAGVVLGVSAVAGAVIKHREDLADAEVAERNARAADEAADQALWRGEVAARLRQQKTRQTIGTQKAAVASAGFDPGFGTSLDILTDTAAAGATDADLIKYNASVEAHRARVGAVSQRNLAARTRAAAPVRAIAGGVSGGATALGSWTPRYRRSPLQSGEG